MRSEERQKQIMDLLARQKFMRTKDIIASVDSSPATVRRDLVAMERDGLVRKARGKVFPQEPDKAPTYDLRGLLHDAEKNAIGKAAAALVEEGDSIILDSGTTILAMAGHLRDFKRLSVITNSIPVAYMFHETDVRTFLCGGMLADMALVDDDAIAYFAARRVNKVFFGATGVWGCEGLTVFSSHQHAVKRQMLASAAEAYALIDSSKFDVLGITMFANFSELDGVITSRPLKDGKLAERLESLGTRVVYADFDDAEMRASLG